MKKETKNGICGVVSMTASALFVKVLGFFYKIPLSHALGDEGMGYYNSALNVYALFFILCSSAIPKSFSVILTKARLYQTKTSYRKTFIFLGFIVCSFGLVSCLGLSVYSHRIASLLGFNNASRALLYISPAVALSTFASVTRGYLLSYERFGCVGISECIEAVFKLFSGIAFVYLGTKAEFELSKLSALAVLGITLGSFVSFLFLLISSLLVNRSVCEFQGKIRFSAKTAFFSFLKISIPLTLGGMLYSLSTLLDVRIISSGLMKTGLSSTQSAILYGNYSTLVLPLLSFVNSIAAAFSLSLFPKLCFFKEKNDEVSFLKILRSAVYLLFCVSLLVSVGFYFYGEDYFTLLFKAESVSLGTQALKICAISALFISLLTLLNTALEARGHHCAPLISFGAGALVKIPVSILMIPRFGIMGAAYSFVVCYAVAFAISFVLLSREIGFFMPGLKQAVSMMFVIFSGFSIGVLVKNIVVNTNSLAILRLVPIALTCIICVFFMLFISKTTRNSVKILSKYTK